MQFWVTHYAKDVTARERAQERFTRMLLWMEIFCGLQTAEVLSVLTRAEEVMRRIAECKIMKCMGRVKCRILFPISDVDNTSGRRVKLLGRRLQQELSQAKEGQY